MSEQPVIIIGAGPAGLTAAYESLRQGILPLVLERTDKVGGLARTESYRGYTFDIGGHRFFTKIPRIQRLWEEMLGDDFLRVPRKSSIYYQGHFFTYPPEFFDVFSKLGIVECMLIILSYLRAKIRPHPRQDTFEEWVSNHFGHRFFLIFFQKYTEKVWGIPCNRLRADWAAQRIKGLSLAAVVYRIFFGRNTPKSLIGAFSYPRKGAGMMWERFQEAVTAGGGQVRFHAELTNVKIEDGKITRITTREDGEMVERPVGHLISSIPVNRLIGILDADVPDDVKTAARNLLYRSHLTVGLIVAREELFPDQWIYVHDPAVRVARIQNFKNWSADMVPDPRTSSVGMEYFANVGDDLWNMSDAEMIALASRELAA
ncbi:FAD-dependent oxidoreductase, partial [Candidatus Latescibacterota bacterium]